MKKMTMFGFERKKVAGALLIAMWLVGMLGAWAQIPAPTRVSADVEEPVVIMQKTPEFQAVTSESKKDPKRREWLELEVKFQTVSDSKVGIIPEITITYYLLMKGVERQVITGSFNYANIVDKEDNYAVVYVSPQGLTRIAGEPNKFRVGDVQAAAVEIVYQGRVVAETSAAKSFNATALPRSGEFLLPKEKTPFGMLWIDRHVELKPER